MISQTIAVQTPIMVLDLRDHSQMNAVHERHLSRGVIHVCIVRSVGGDWKFTVKPQSWRYCWKNIFCLLDLNSWHIHFLRDSDFLRDFLDGHNCWDCTTSRRLYARTVLRSRKVSPMFAGRNSLIRPVGCLDMVPSPIFVIIFWESLSKNTSDYNRHQRGHKWSIGLNTIFSVSMSVFWMSSAGLWLQRSVHL